MHDRRVMPLLLLPLGAMLGAMPAWPAPARGDRPPILVIAAERSPMRNAPTDDLRKAFVGERDPAGVKAAIAMPPMTAAETSQFLKLFLGLTRERFEALWKFRQKGMARIPPRHFDSISAILAVVRVYPTTLGVVQAMPDDLGEGLVILWRSDNPERATDPTATPP